MLFRKKPVFSHIGLRFLEKWQPAMEWKINKSVTILSSWGDQWARLTLNSIQLLAKTISGIGYGCFVKLQYSRSRVSSGIGTSFVWFLKPTIREKRGAFGGNIAGSTHQGWVRLAKSANFTKFQYPYDDCIRRRYSQDFPAYIVPSRGYLSLDFRWGGKWDYLTYSRRGLSLNPFSFRLGRWLDTTPRVCQNQGYSPWVSRFWHQQLELVPWIPWSEL